MLNRLFPLLTILAAVLFTACNSKEEEYDYQKASTVKVDGFSLSEDEKVLDSLQNVFFSIDLVDAKIFNADSLPYGTKIDKLIPVIKTPSTVSAVVLAYPRPGKTDSVVDYLKNSMDSIDFSNGPVKLTVKSQSGSIERVYEIKVNVHAVKADTLAWNRMESAPLPSSFTRPDAQYTVRLNDTFYCLTSKSGKYCLAVTSDLDNPIWDLKEIQLPFDPNVESLRTTDDAFYMLSSEGNLYSSADFEEWTSTGQNWHYCYGNYGNQLLGSCNDSQKGWIIVSYPNMDEWACPEDFPISGTSQTAIYDVAMGFGPQMVFLGGRTSSGKLLNGAWGFDGSEWIYMTKKGISYQLEDMMMAAYTVFNVPTTTWTPEKCPALIAFGGRTDTGAVNTRVFISTDWGISWNIAPTLMQLPAELPKVYGAALYVHNTTMHSSRSDYDVLWTPLAMRNLPPQCRWVMPEMPMSRFDKLPTEWECAAMYMFGGRNPDGNIVASLWRGLILRYTFPPVY